MQELIKVNYENDRPTVLGRDLHRMLEVKTAYKDWFPRMCEYGFNESVDFNPLNFEQVHIEGNREVKRKVKDHQLTIEMAKEICMLQRSDKGKQARQYFIELEKQWNTPEQVMARALRMADSTITKLQHNVNKLTVENQIMKPKSDYFDELVDRNTLTNFTETAKQLQIQRKVLINFLLDKKFIYRDKKGKILPYENKNKGYFEIKESYNEKTNWSGTQTLITPKGREAFKLMLVG